MSDTRQMDALSVNGWGSERYTWTDASLEEVANKLHGVTI